MKRKILELINESSKAYWDKSEGTHSKLSENDMQLRDKLDNKLIDDIISLFESK